MVRGLIRSVLDRLNKTVSDVYLVNIGAFDGISNDYFYDYIKNHQWRGVLVEPTPSSFAKLKENYAGLDSAALENSAIAEMDGEMAFFVPVLTDDMPSWLPQTATLSKQHIHKTVQAVKSVSTDERKYSDPLMTEIKVPTLTLSSLLAKYAVAKVDVLNIDAEGYDFKILRQLDFSRFKPYVIIYEYYNLDYLVLLRSVFWLSRRGYRLFWSSTDILAVRSDAFTEFVKDPIPLKNRLPIMLLRRFPLVTFVKERLRRL